jgi:two-component system phosphate regulon sensor histidine kinase PhoR
VRLHALVEDLLDLSRIESREVQLVSEALLLAPLVTQIVELFRARAQEREITLQISVDASLPPARVDRSAFERVLTNLIDNAIKYAGQGCSVRVSARDAGELLEVTVADTGPASPPSTSSGCRALLPVSTPGGPASSAARDSGSAS